MRKYEIVCVDDEQVILDLYEDALNELGYTVKTFSNPINAIDYIVENKSLVVGIISDYKMPGLTGLEIRERLIDKNIYTPFLMVTGFYNKEMALKGMELKVSRFIQKPYDHQDLLMAIKPEADRQKATLEEEFEMIRSFVEESYPMIEEIEDLILQLEDDPGDINVLNTYFRLLHTIKGTASCVGLVSLPEYTHKYEDLIGELKQGHLKVNNHIIDILLAGLDELKFMYKSISDGEMLEFEISEKIKVFSEENIKREVTTEVKEVEEEVKVKQVSKKEEEEKLGVSVSLLDEFMELSGEITVLRNMVLKSVSKIESKYHGDKDIDVLSVTLDEMHKVSSQLQGQISEMRKIQVGSIYRPLKRVVRDASKKLGKDVDLALGGDELRIDTSVGRVLSNALIHIVRNGIDHGIETIEKRKEIGKNAQGSLSISTEIETDYINVRISDDGNGIDIDRLVAKAIEKNLYVEDELQSWSKQKLLNLIFDSGFSTAEQVTDISGRGVGMDMVKSSVESIGGRIFIDSNVGQGTTFLLQIPIPRSVLIIKSLMISIDQTQFAVPLDDVAEVVILDKSKNKLEVLNDSLIMKHMGELLPILDLKKKFYTSEDTDYIGKGVVVIQTDRFKYGLLVDNVHDIEEIVVKKLVDKLQYDEILFQGATLIGDGDMALIFDLEKIAVHYDINVDDIQQEYEFEHDTNTFNSVQEFIQVSLWNEKNQYCIGLDEVSRLEEFKTSDIDYSGDLLVYRYRDNFLPIVSGTIVEGHKVKTKLPEILNVVVIEKDDKKIGFVVEEIQDIVSSNEPVDTLIKTSDMLLGTVYINGKTLSVIDTENLLESYKVRAGGCFGGEVSEESSFDDAA